MKFLLRICSVLLLFSACKESANEEPIPVSEPTLRTVIVYMAGDNNLGSRGYLDTDLSEIVQGSRDIPANNRLVVFVDNAGSSKLPYIAEVKNGVCDTLVRFSENFYVSDPARFSSVISTIESRCPAKEYGLVLWGHATGWLVTADSVSQSRPASSRFRAYGADGGSSVNFTVERWMNITQMSRALSSLPRFKFIFADCCCMMDVEVAYQLRKATDYLIGSPSEIPGPGAPYHLMVKDLFLRTDDFYKTMIDDYYNYYLALYQTSEYAYDSSTKYLKGYSVPLSAVDMRYVDELAAVTRDLIVHPDSFQTDSVPYYFQTDVPIMYDMGCLLERICSQIDYQRWKTTFDKAVTYKRFSARWMTVYSSLMLTQIQNKFRFDENNFSGVSMYVPKSSYNFSSLYQYNATIPSFDWYHAVGWGRFGEWLDN